MPRFEVKREDLPGVYKELMENNGLLARIRGELETNGFTEVEILQMQLMVTVKSNHGLQLELKKTNERLSMPKNLRG